jgi:hypothetical protein
MLRQFLRHTDLPETLMLAASVLVVAAILFAL